MASRRSYTMTARADAARETGERILDAAEALFLEHSFAELSLGLIAERAEVTVQTLIRRYGSKEQLVAVVAERVMARVLAQRSQAVPGDAAGAIDNLLEHYESVGQLVLRMLAQEHIPALAAIAAKGRRLHRQWVERTLGPLVTTPERRARRARLDELAAVTDITVWKLFRRDWRRSRAETAQSLRRMLDRLVDTR